MAIEMQLHWTLGRPRSSGDSCTERPSRIHTKFAPMKHECVMDKAIQTKMVGLLISTMACV